LKLSRFARNCEDSIIYKSLLKKRGIQIVSINEPVDDSPAGALFERMIEVIDEFYSANLAQDSKRGLKGGALRGYSNGGQAPLGYRRERVADGSAKRVKFVPDPYTAPVVIRIFRLCL
jgi:DNA invertase Pin-like site-specific DNA recombinase